MSSTELADKAKDTVEDAADSEWMERLARFALASRGFVYCVVALLALRLANGESSEQADREGALQAVARQPFGKLLLVAVAVGFAGYTVWRFTKAIVGAREGKGSKRGIKDVAVRLADAGRGLLYVTSTWVALKIAFGDNSAPGDEQEQEWTARLLERSHGTLLVTVIGLAIVAGGVYLASRGARQKFKDSLRVSAMRRWERAWLPRLGVVGYIARGLVIATIGAFVAHAALTFDADDAVGVDGALKRLAQDTWGTALLVAIALGLLCFGAFSFVEARYRKVLED